MKNTDPTEHNPNLTTPEDMRAFGKAVIEKIRNLHGTGRYLEFLSRCTAAGISKRTIHRWLQNPDTRPHLQSMRLAASILKELGFHVDASVFRKIALEKRQHERETKAKNLRGMVTSVLDGATSLKKHKCTVTVLFADLVGSGELKRTHTEIDWLTKMILHNDVAERCVVEKSGRVIKFLGDSVMAEFEGTNHAERAIDAGLSIIKTMELENSEHGYKDNSPVETAVGVATGNVYRLVFEQSLEPDPLGSIVDLASRLCDLADARQLICSTECFDEATKNQSTLNSSRELVRFIKGCDDPVRMRLVLPEGRMHEDIRQVGHRRDTRPENMKLLDDARSALDKRGFDEAEKILKNLVQTEPGNFEANFHLAELLLRRALRTPEQRLDFVKKSTKHLNIASQVNPDAWRVWYLASTARRLSFDDSRDYVELDRAIEHTRTAINKAEQFMDTDGVSRAKLALAELLFLRSEDPSADGAEDLAEAAIVCNDIEYAFNGEQTRRRSDHLVTSTLVALAQGSKPRSEIKRMLQKTVDIDNNNPKALRALAKFLEGDDGVEHSQG